MNLDPQSVPSEQLLSIVFQTYCSAKSLISEFFFGSWAPNWLQGNSRNLTLDQLNGVSLEMIHIKHQPGMSWHDQPDLMISIPVDTSACGQLSESSMCDVWLVGGIPTPLKNMKFSWDYDIPNIWNSIKCSKPPTRWLCVTMCDSVWLCVIACPACHRPWFSTNSGRCVVYCSTAYNSWKSKWLYSVYRWIITKIYKHESSTTPMLAVHWSLCRSVAFQILSYDQGYQGACPCTTGKYT